MKNLIFCFLFFFIGFHCLQAQNITYRFANKVTTATSVSFDVTIDSDADFKMGSGQIYLNYNPAAFGPSAFTAGDLIVTQPNGSILAQSNGFPIYKDFISNDNTDSRFSFSWQQGVSSGGIPENNVTSTPTVLYHVTINFTNGGSSQPDQICFESGEIFDDQTFTACGPSSFGFANCQGFPGMQLMNDNFNCSFGPLPVELSLFDARLLGDDKVALIWQTQNEQNNDHFIIERSIDGRNFKEIDRVQGQGTFNGETNYNTIDEHPFMGINYYRLMQVDHDGAFDYSAIRSVTFKGDETQISVFPNPTINTINIEISKDNSNSQIKLFDQTGKMVLQRSISATDQRIEIKLGHLPKAMYYLRIQTGDEVFSERIILQ